MEEVQLSGKRSETERAYQILSNMFKFLTKKNNIDGEWRKVSELSVGMEMAVPKNGVLEAHENGAINSREWIGENDVLWDEIVSIEYEGEEQVWDIEVEGTHNFIGNNIFAHNTYINGSLGVGTTSPESKLHVEGSESGNSIARFINNNAAGYGVYINNVSTSAARLSLEVG